MRTPEQGCQPIVTGRLAGAQAPPDMMDDRPRTVDQEGAHIAVPTFTDAQQAFATAG